MNAPAECRILTALLLMPMDIRTLAQCLSIRPMTARHRVAYLRSTREVQAATAAPGRSTKYKLTRKGESWARELIA